MHYRERVYDLLLTSGLAYSRQPQIKGMTCTPVFRGGTEAFACVDDDDIYIVFRGTSSITDVVTDVDFRKTTVPGLRGKFHRGIAKALDQVYWQLYSKIQFSHPRNIYITGHSLGGALAVLFANKLYNSDELAAGRITLVCTFGAPRVSNVFASAEYDKVLYEKTIQFENWGDEVTHAPMMWLGFRHVGVREVLDRPVGFKRKFKLWTLRLLHKLTTTRLQHAMVRYTVTVRRWMDGAA